jgi:GcrA cell cycle regulator
MRQKSTSWTEEENERLKELVAKGASLVKAAGVFNRSMGNVRIQARKLGTPFPRISEARKKWAGTPSSVWRPS